MGLSYFTYVLSGTSPSWLYDNENLEREAFVGSHRAFCLFHSVRLTDSMLFSFFGFDLGKQLPYTIPPNIQNSGHVSSPR